MAKTPDSKVDLWAKDVPLDGYVIDQERVEQLRELPKYNGPRGRGAEPLVTIARPARNH